MGHPAFALRPRSINAHWSTIISPPGTVGEISGGGGGQVLNSSFLRRHRSIRCRPSLHEHQRLQSPCCCRQSWTLTVTSCTNTRRLQSPCCCRQSWTLTVTTCTNTRRLQSPCCCRQSWTLTVTNCTNTRRLHFPQRRTTATRCLRVPVMGNSYLYKVTNL